MSQQKLIDLFSDLANHLPNKTIVDSEHHQRLVEIIESLEAQKVDANLQEDEKTIENQENAQSEYYDEFDEIINQLMVEYEADHPKSMAILQAIKQSISNAF